MENTANHPDAAHVAACGLYCGGCRKFTNGKCPGCAKNEKAQWCKIRACCKEHGYASCADCTLMPLNECRKFNNFIGKVFSILFKSDRPACIARIKTIGYDAYANEMHEKKLQTIKKK